MISFLFLLILLAAAVAIAEYAVPMAPPFKIAIRVTVAVILIWYLLAVLTQAGIIEWPRGLR